MSGRTFFIDIDGTIVKHVTNHELDEILANASEGKSESKSENTHENNEFTEVLLPNVKEFWAKFTENDRIIITTARKEEHRKLTEKIFTDNNLYYDALIMELPSGPRVLINDTPDMMYKKAIAINVKRDEGFWFEQ